jgi:hypothetical protein
MSDMTIGGDIGWKDFKKFRDQNTFVMVCGEVYPETIADFLEMQAESLGDSLRKILK